MILLVVNLEAGDILGDGGRVAIGIIGIGIYFGATAMRLRDAGKSMGHILILFIMPLYILIIVCYESEEPRSVEESGRIDKDMESMNRVDKW